MFSAPKVTAHLAAAKSEKTPEHALWAAIDSHRIVAENELNQADRLVRGVTSFDYVEGAEATVDDMVL